MFVWRKSTKSWAIQVNQFCSVIDELVDQDPLIKMRYKGQKFNMRRLRSWRM